MIKLLGSVTIMKESRGILFIVSNCIVKAVGWSSSSVDYEMASIVIGPASEFLISRPSVFSLM